MPRNSIILGAAGRDFHTFNVFFRDNPEYKVVAFTATQIPYIANRTYPPSVAGRLYPKGVPIYPEERLGELIPDRKVTDVFFAYSDVSDERVMDLASIAQSKGASFHLLGPGDTMIRSRKPVVAVVADRTGAGKSTISRLVAQVLLGWGLKPVVVRHPMPYGDLSVPVQRFETPEDLDRYQTTVEEREEYEGHIDRGIIVYAGVDYQAILTKAEAESDVIIWDGGNNDFSFYKPDLNIVVVDPLRLGDQSRYYPGETNVRMADVIVINKVNAASPKDVQALEKACQELNPGVKVVRTKSEAVVDEPRLVRGKRVLVVEDGPSVTHGGLKEGAGAFAARALGAVFVSPREEAVGSIRSAYDKFPRLGDILPALGYSKEQLHDLELSINNVRCDTVVLGTPCDLRRLIQIKKPVARVTFEAAEVSGLKLEQVMASNEVLSRLRRLRGKKAGKVKGSSHGASGFR